MIDRFEGKYDFLSNFFVIPVSWGGIIYRSAENAYQAGKTIDDEIRIRIAPMTPSLAKKFGREIPLRANWNQVKLDVMEEILRIKFSGPIMKGRLLSTDDERLIEGNWWGDTFWGVYRGQGANHLGEILMKIREELRSGM